MSPAAANQTFRRKILISSVCILVKLQRNRRPPAITGLQLYQHPESDVGDRAEVLPQPAAAVEAATAAAAEHLPIPLAAPPAATTTNIHGDAHTAVVENATSDQQSPKRVRAAERVSTATAAATAMSGRGKRALTVTVLPAAARAEAFAVYRRYQMAVHGDADEDLTLEKYQRFLCDSPLTLTPTQADGVALGSFHVEYRIDGRLVMVDVVDVLPQCLSSVYFFYDPAFAFLSPGVVSALFEVERVQQIQRQLPQLKYVYLGFYIHTCPKMRYKVLSCHVPSFSS